VNQAFDVNVVEHDKNSECDDRADGAAETLTHSLTHVVTLEPGLHVARRFIGSAFGVRTMHPELQPISRLIALAAQRRLDGAMH
jgi:hypothetical protein